jgi:hypothetical protein
MVSTSFYRFRESRRPYNDDFDDYEYERRPYRNRNRSESRRNGNDQRTEDRRFNRRPYNDDRRGGDDRRVNDERRRPAEDERRSYDDRRPQDDRRTSDDRRVSDDRKKLDDDRVSADERKINRRKNEEPVDEKGKDRFDTKQTAEESINDDKLVKPAVSLFDRPRVPPKIARPVPLSEKNKFSYKATDDAKKKDEYYEEEYDDVSSSSSTTTTTTTTTTSTTQKPTTTTTRYSPRRQTSTTTSTTTTRKPTTTELPEVEYYDDEYEDSVPPPSSTTPKLIGIDRSSFFNRNANKIEKPVEVSTAAPVVKPSITDTFKFNRFKSQFVDPAVKELLTTKVEETTLPQTTSRKPLPLYGGKKFANQQTQFDQTTVVVDQTTRAIPQEFAIDTRFNSRETDPVEDPRMVVRVIKRPFLPSRGGNPYKARGLQPVGPSSTLENFSMEIAPSAPETAPSAPETAPASGPDQTSAPPNIHKTTLDDIYNEEYDVELNDALNPNLKPLTSSRGISGFSFSSLPNDSRDGYRSQSIKNIQRAEAPKTSTTTTTEAPLYEYYDDDYESK